MVRLRNDILLNEAIVMDYLGQVGPVPFSHGFAFATEISNLLSQFNVGKAYPVLLNDRPILRPHANSCEVRMRVEAKFTELETFQVPAIADGLDAVGWILHSEYLGAIPEKAGIKGLRLRIGNMQVGDSRLFDAVFPEPRFNAWAVGECHVLSNRLVPNGRRDDLEQNSHYANLITHISPRAKSIARACRQQSSKRAQQKEQEEKTFAENVGINWSRAKHFFVSNATKKLAREHRKNLKTTVRRYSATYTDIVASLTTPVGKVKMRP